MELVALGLTRSAFGRPRRRGTSGVRVARSAARPERGCPHGLHTVVPGYEVHPQKVRPSSQHAIVPDVYLILPSYI